MKIVNVTELQRENGIKCLVFGPPGTAKTPMVLTAPRPLYIAVENGVRSISPATRLASISAKTVPEINEMRKFITSDSKELAQFDTIAFDSLSEIGEKYLADALTKRTNGLQAFGDLSRNMRKLLADIMSLKRKHVYMIAKFGVQQVGEEKVFVPSFPGQDLNSFIPHELDFIWYISRRIVPNGTEQIAIQTQASSNVMARSRVPLDWPKPLAILERPHLGSLFAKLMP